MSKYLNVVGPFIPLFDVFGNTVVTRGHFFHANIKQTGPKKTLFKRPGQNWLDLVLDQSSRVI